MSNLTIDHYSVSPEPGLLIRVCSDDTTEYMAIHCTLCGHYHHHPENRPACQEFQLLLTADENTIPTWDAVMQEPVQQQMPVDTETHDHHGRLCSSEECMPCPGCGGQYDGEDFGGRGCSRACAYGDMDY